MTLTVQTVIKYDMTLFDYNMTVFAKTVIKYDMSSNIFLRTHDCVQNYRHIYTLFFQPFSLFLGKKVEYKFSYLDKS